MKIIDNLFGIQEEISTLNKAKFQVELYKVMRLLEEVQRGYEDIFAVIYDDMTQIDAELDALAEKKIINAKHVKELRQLKAELINRYNIISEQLKNK